MAEAKRRHGCLTAWLILMLVANSLGFLIYLLGGELVSDAYPDAPAWVFTVMMIFSLFNLICTVALFQWKKWGFWGFCASSVVGLLINLSIGVGIGSTIFGLIGVALLYGVLQIGKDNKGWPQLD